MWEETLHPSTGGRLEFDARNRCEMGGSDLQQCTRVLVCSLLYTRVLVCSLLYTRVLVCSLLYTRVLVCSQLYTRVLVCFLLYTRVLVCSLLCTRVLVCSLLCTRVLVCSQLYTRVLVCSLLHCPVPVSAADEAFNSFDKRDEGRIRVNDISGTMRKLGHNIKPDFLEKMEDYIDTDGEKVQLDGTSCTFGILIIIIIIMLW